MTTDSETTGRKAGPWPRRAAVGGLLALLLLAFLAIRACRGTGVPADRVVRRDVVETLVVNGRVLAESKSAIASRLVGIVQEVPVREGDRVKKGQLLVLLNETEARAELEEARGRLVQAEARLADLRGTGARVTSEAVRQARFRFEQADRNRERMETLFARKVVSESEVEDARRAAELARSVVGAAESQARSSGPGGNEERRAEASLAEARAARDVKESRLAQLRITAPSDGTVLARSVEPGDVVQPGKSLFVLALASEALLLAQPDEKNLGSLRVGQKARASADAYPAESFAAEVSWIAPAVDVTRGTVDVKLRVPDPPATLKTDMTLSVEIEVGRKAGALVVPAESVRDAGRRPWVLVAKGGRAARRDVVLGLVGEGGAEVLSGLSEGELVLRAAPPVVPGARVHATGVPSVASSTSAAPSPSPAPAAR